MVTAARPVTVADEPLAAADDRVVAAGAVDDDLVDRAVGWTEIDVDLCHVGAREVVHRDLVRAAERVEVDALDVVQVHHYVGDVAREEHALAVRQHVDLLADVGAVEEHRVEAGLALERVVVVARVPDEGVIARAADEEVVAVAAEDFQQRAPRPAVRSRRPRRRPRRP